MIHLSTFTGKALKSPENGQNGNIMGILENLRARVQSVEEGLRSGILIRGVVVNHADDILELQKLQLFQGLASDGNDIRPYYSEDLKPNGYFYSVESAGRYAAWKQDGINYPYSVDRNPDAPNLYINGRFHDELGVQFMPQAVGVVGTTGYSKKIIAKYGLKTFGLMAINWMRIFQERGAYNELMNEIKSKLYAKQ